ncbi:MAG TPA: NUDIX hydrolase [Candidatus Woesebacteria bacterium]|nr:NUDIX hydrolase [Candidatus Woesebacteria bacterium]
MDTKLNTSFCWVGGDVIKNEHQSTKVNQVYVWILTADNKIILVSKDGQKWQFPGGHPELGETFVETAVREVSEEAGQDITDISDKLRFFGYYFVSEPNSEGTSLVDILQTRFFIKLEKNSQDLTLKSQEKETEKMSERINFVKAFTIAEACDIIPWLGKSDELKTFKKKAGITN